MALPNNPIIEQDGYIKIRDGAGTPKEYTVVYEDGDFKVTGLKKGGAALKVFNDRGVPYAAREGELISFGFSFSAHAVTLTEGTTGTLRDVVMKEGEWSDAESKLTAAQGGAYMLEVEWGAERSDFGGSADAKTIFKFCELTVDFEESSPSKFSISGTAYMFGGYANAVTWS